ncbi:armadillo repeat-containing protein gudu-like isoform X2 [Centruroides sculpturatus]|uniref:armadillo repeat-containing protein gudu-like isoform X2 n=1 Tax=Centruroides sculpturatus TaxID=218467 RepID=UPI000C6ED98A|nr:armadillo repeat-containing protein gudu-like isoform X2 [Centruroides sculpturatus]
MGQAISHYYRRSTVADDRRVGLEYTRINKIILREIVDWLNEFTKNYKRESDLKFKSPLIWHTKLREENFSPRVNQTDDFDKLTKEDIKIHNLPGGGGGLLHIFSFKQAQTVIRIAGSYEATEEVRCCLEENPDPLVNILGDAFANVEEVNKGIFPYIDLATEQEAKKKDQMESVKKHLYDSKLNSDSLQLLMILQQFDTHLLKVIVKEMSRNIRLNKETLEKELNLLDAFNTYSKSQAIRFTNFAIDTYLIPSTGKSAPLWRQLHGDIAYLMVELSDGSSLSVTYNTNGCFLNKGFDKSKNDLNYERDGEIFPDLISLLKAYSKQFSKDFNNKKEFRVLENTGQMISDEGTDYQTKQKLIKERITKKSDKEEQKLATDNRSSSVFSKQSLRNSSFSPEQISKNTQQPTKININLNRLTATTDKILKLKKGSGNLIRQKKNRKKLSIPKKTAVKKEEDNVESKSEEDDDYEEEEEEENIEGKKVKEETDAKVTAETIKILKLIKSLKFGDCTNTVLSLCLLQECDVHLPANQKVIEDSNCITLLLNLLETDVLRCQIGALKVLREIASNPAMRHSIICLGGLDSMVKILSEPSLELRCLLAETIANVVHCHRSAIIVRKGGGIPYLIELLDVSNQVLRTEKPKPIDQLELEGARCGALALWNLCRSGKNKRLVTSYGVVPLLGRLIKCRHINILIPVIGMIQQCASQKSFQQAICTEGLLDDILIHLNKPNIELQKLCASAIFKCAEDEESRELLGKQDGLKQLVKLIADPENKDKKELVAAVTGAIWKCALSMKNVVKLQELSVINVLVDLLQNQPEAVLINVVGGLGLCAKLPANSKEIQDAGGIELMVQLLTRTNQTLLVNVTQAVGTCAVNEEGMKAIEELDGVRLLWSQLNNKSPEVQISAAWALCPCIRNAKDSGRIVNSFVGGLEQLVSLLNSNNTKLLTAVCALISEVARDEQNLAVMTDYGIVNLLSQLCHMSDIHLQQHLAGAIAACCSWKDNRVKFGSQGVVSPLVTFLQSNIEDIQCQAVTALYQLSLEPANCITMHNDGAVRHLIKKIASTNRKMQEEAADCLFNIRALAIKTEELKLKF